MTWCPDKRAVNRGDRGPEVGTIVSLALMLPSPIREKEEQMHAVRTTAGAAGSQALLDGFTRYLRAERGVAALTVDAYLSDVRPYRSKIRRGD
jgi:hypothetical protein